MNAGLIGAIAGSLIGVSGGLIGTWVSIRNAGGPREQAFVMRASLVCWFGIATFLAAMFLLPQARFWLWIPYSILLPLGIRHGNRKQMEIRRREQEAA